MRSTGLIAPGSDPRDGIFDSSSSPGEFTSIGAPSYPDITKLQAMAAAHCTPEYHDFLQNPQMREFVREFMGWGKEVLLARTLLRHCVPHGISSAIHYDKIFLRGGDPANDFLTAWVPIGDVAHDGGGLIYLKHSTEIGRQIEANFTEKAQTLPPEERLRAYNKNMASNGSLGTDAQEFYENEGRDFKAAKEWLTADYEAGDVIFHNPYIVHGTTLNEDHFNRIRLSTDLRFYQEGTSVDERWMKVWMPTDGL
jgi:phytanoyl-CoA hydroxylase